MLKRTIATVFVTALLCLFALPVTALAAENDRPYSLYVGNTDVAKTEYSDNAAYWTSSDGGANWTSQLDEPTADSYIHYDGNGTLTLHNVNISRSNENGIYAEAMSGSAVSLTIKLEGTNTVSGWSGIFVHTVFAVNQRYRQSDRRRNRWRQLLWNSSTKQRRQSGTNHQ